MYFLGTFAVEQAGEFGTDVGFFPFPLLGTEFDGENAIDAPIDGFMLSANPKNPDAAKAFLKCVATPEAQVAYVTSPGIGSVAVSPMADTSGYTDVQKMSAEVLEERRQHRPVPRPRRAGRLRRAVGHAGLPHRLPDRPEPGPRRVPG